MSSEVVELVVGVLHELMTDMQEVTWLAVEQLGWDGVLQTVINELRRLNSLGCNHGKYRSLIRLIGSNLPIKRVQRPVLCLGPYERFTPEINSTWTGELLEYSDEVESSRSLDVLNHQCDDTASVASLGSTSTSASKMATLEDELAHLKSQIAHLMLNHQSQVNPPPPPPPMMVEPPVVKVEKQCSRDVRSENVESDRQPCGMMAVLQNLGSVKLKPVERSPGGTPLRLHNRLETTCNDPGTIIAHALKRRFERIHCIDEESSENEMDELKENFETVTSSFSPKQRGNDKRQLEVPYNYHGLRG